jgi:hypothetical protein
MKENEIRKDVGGEITYVVQSYYDQNDELVSRSKFGVSDEQKETMLNLNCDEVKHTLLKHGIWPQYTKRIKNLEKVEGELWKLYEKGSDLSKKTRVLENIANLQSIIASCYIAGKEILAPQPKGELSN